jgi:hypothetical protein
MTEGKTVKLLDILENEKYRVFNKVEDVEVKPTALFKGHKIPKAKQFSFTIRPMTYSEKKRLDAAAQSKANSSDFAGAMNRAGVTWKDLYGTDDITSLTEDERVQKINLMEYSKVSKEMRVDTESAETYANELLRVVVACTKTVNLGSEKLDFEDYSDRFSEEYLEFLFESIYRESTLTDQEALSLV